jgi:peptide/nickel transport system ATP-binding protein
MTRLRVEGASVGYGSGTRAVPVLKGVDLDVPPGSLLGVVGESGSGKSTLARAIAGLVPLQGGRISLDEHTFGRHRSRSERRRIQMAFQDPSTSLNPRMSVEQTLYDACQLPRAQRGRSVSNLLAAVGLDEQHRRSLPRELSGGQRQRVSLARALAANPDILICDEVTSALDAATRTAILGLLVELQERHGFSLLFISHDLGAVRQICTQVAVMYAGQIVEYADVRAVTHHPEHPYTRALLEAVPSIDRPRLVEPVDFEPVDPRDPPPGCRFHPRCPVGPNHALGREICEKEDPASGSMSRVNRSACHFARSASDPEPQPLQAQPPMTDRRRISSAHPSGGVHPILGTD